MSFVSAGAVGLGAPAPPRCREGLGCAKSRRTKPAPCGCTARPQHYGWKQGGDSHGPRGAPSHRPPSWQCHRGACHLHGDRLQQTPQAAANADESELCLAIPLHEERILILNYHLFHRRLAAGKETSAAKCSLLAERWRAWEPPCKEAARMGTKERDGWL